MQSVSRPDGTPVAPRDSGRVQQRAAAPGWPVGVARVLIGVLWFQQLLWKLPPDFGCTPARDQGLCDWIQREIDSPMLPLYATFLRGIVQPNLGVLGWLIWLLEAAVAVSLLLGILTRLGGWLGFAQAMNLYVGLAAVPHEWFWTYWMLTILCALFALTGAWRWLGLDGWLPRRRRIPPLLPRAGHRPRLRAAPTLRRAPPGGACRRAGAGGQPEGLRRKAVR